MNPILIVGAGMAGLTLARTLGVSAIPCELIDKSRSVGGRLATRRKGAANLDHGAPQYQIPLLTHELWRAKGAVRSAASDGTGPFFGHTGMNRLAKLLREELATSGDTGVTLTLESHLKSLSRDADGTYHPEFLAAPHAATRAYSDVVFTCPLPQMIEIVERSNLSVDSALLRSFREIEYHRQIVALLWNTDPILETHLKAEARALGLVEVVDHQERGVSPIPAKSLYWSPQRSADLWDTDDSIIRAQLLGALHLPPDFQNVEIKRWRYAQVQNPSLEGYFRFGPGLWYCGDACASAARDPSVIPSGIQRAERSALALAAELVKKPRNC